MAIVEVISKLSTAEISAKEEHYLNLVKLFSENTETVFNGLNNEHIKDLCTSILDDLKKETTELPYLAKLMQFLFNNKHLQKFFHQSKKIEVIKSIIDIVDSSQHENILVNCFSVFILISPLPIENSMLNDLLQRMEEILSKKNDVASTYSICCFFQKILKDYEERLSNFIPVLSKLVFLPLCHPSTKVREVAEKTLDAFPKLLLYTSDVEASNYLIKLVKESFSKNLLLLFKEKQELYALKVWTHVINALGSALHTNLTGIMPFFAVLERGFKSSVDDICIASFVAWKSLINSFAATDGVLNDSKILRFTLKPFKNVSRQNENVVSVVCDTWWHLAWNLAGHLSNRFSEVCIPLLELTIGKITNGHHEKSFPKGGLISKDVKKCCYILLRFLEQPPSESFNRLSSPKKLPNISYPALQTPLDIKVITHHFKEILQAFKIIIDVCGTKDDMKFHLDTLMKSVLFIVSSTIEDSNKESVEAVISYLNFLCDIIEAKSYPSLLCLKSLESLSKLPRKILVSHCFSCGSRKSQDILCTSLLKLLLTPHLFPSEAPKRFFAAYNRLVQAGIYESFHALSVTHKFMHIIRNAVGGNSFDVEVLIDVWSGIATPLLEVIEKTQEVNQGDKQEHDFSCMYDVLLFPFEFIFPIYIHQFRTRPAFKLWTSLYKAFICSTSLVTTTSSNEACEMFCCKLKELLKEDLLKKPHFFETLCLFMQLAIDSIDFSFGSTSGNQVSKNVCSKVGDYDNWCREYKEHINSTIDAALLVKRKKPLGNLSSFVNLLTLTLMAYHDHYIEEDNSVQSSAPLVQRKLHIVRSAAPLDVLKAFFGNLKSGNIISYILEQLIPPISKLFLKSSLKRSSGNHVDSKLELVWNVLSSSIERYYLGPYDSEFLALMSPLLEATFSHPKRNFKEKSRRFWFATFGPNASSLKFPDSLKTLLKKMKLPLLPDDISPTEFSISPMTDSATEDNMIIDVPATPKPTFVKPQSFKTPSLNGETTKVLTKDQKQSSKISIDDLPSEEFVKIESPVINTTQRRGIRKRKSFVPTLYNDLSQDTATLMSSSESQDTVNSASLEETEMKEPRDESKRNPQEAIENSVPMDHKDTLNVSKNTVKTPLLEKTEEQLNKNLEVDHTQIIPQDVITLDSSESSSESNGKSNVQQVTKDSDQTKPKSSEDSAKVSTKRAAGNKISVFSKSGGKCTGVRNTRRFTRLSQSFSFASVSKESETLEYQKLNKSCDEVILLSDSDEIIPSSQSSSENENSSKLAVSKSKSSSVEDKPQKSLTIDNSNKDVGSLPLIYSSPVRKNAENISTNVLIEKNIDTKIITSTPLKSKVINESCKKLQENENVKENLTVATNKEDNTTSKKNNTVSLNIGEPNKAEGNIDKNVLTNEHMDSKLGGGCGKDDIKDLNFLLDAVDDLMQTSPKESCHLIDSKQSPEFPADVEMECEDVSEAKDALSSPPDEKTNKEVVKEPVAKKLRINSKLADHESTYTLKLRKKSIKTVVKSQPNLKRKSLLETSSNSKEVAKNNVKNIESNIIVGESKQLKFMNLIKQETNVKNKENNIKNKIDTGFINEDVYLEGVRPGRKTNSADKNSINSESSEKDLLIEEDTPSIETTNMRKSIKSVTKNKNMPLQKESHPVDLNDPSKKSDLEQNKVSNKPDDDKFENLEAGCVEENSPELAAKLSLEISGRLNDDRKTSTVSNLQTVDSSGSCEIFETLSEKNCENNNKDECNDVVPSDFNDLGDPELIMKKTESSCNPHGLEPYNSSDAEDIICSISCSSIKERKNRVDNSEQNIFIIPSSLNDEDLDTEIKTKAGEESDVGREDVIKLTIKPSPSVNCNVETENKTIKSDLLSVHFSNTEEDLSADMHNIVNAIVDASCENNVNNSSENKSTLFNDENSAKSVSYPSASVNKEKCTDEKFCSQNKLKENVKSSETSKEVLSGSSQEGSSSGGLVTLFNCDSSDVIMSCSPESESENSDKILQYSKENNVEISCSSTEKPSNNMKSIQNRICNAEANELIEKSKDDKQSKKFSPELDHSYSVPENLLNKLASSHESSVKSEIPNTIEIEDIVMRCENQDNLSLSLGKNVIVELNSEVPQSVINLPNLNDSGGSKNVESYDCVPFIEFHNNIPASEMIGKMPISSSNEDEIKYIIQELILQVEILNGSSVDAGITSSTNNSKSFSLKAAIENFVHNSSESFADKENHLLASSDDNLTKGSKKRKIKPPIRSPFNLRMRGKAENSKKLSTKNIKSFSVSQIKSGIENKDLIITSLFPKADGREDESSECSMAKIISSIVDSITDDDNDVTNSEVLPDEPSSSQITKAQRIELSNDELTDLNTRLNASLAPQTRRSKMIAASHKISNETETNHSNVVIVCSGDSHSNLSSILKKRKATSPVPPAKVRKVTFASPLIHEVVIESYSESRGIETVTMNRLQNLTKKRKKILQEKNKTEKGPTVLLPIPTEPEEVPSSSEYQDSDVLDFNDLPVSPALINCPDDVSNILKDLTSPSWVRGLESLLVSKNIKTIGDVCKLNIHQVKALPFKSPKVSTLHKALMTYINVTQDAALEKFKTIDDGSFVTDTASTSSSLPEDSTVAKSEISDDDKSKLLVETLKDILQKGQLKELPMSLLGQLIEACGRAITEKSEQKF